MSSIENTKRKKKKKKEKVYREQERKGIVKKKKRDVKINQNEFNIYFVIIERESNINWLIKL